MGDNHLSHALIDLPQDIYSDVLRSIGIETPSRDLSVTNSTRDAFEELIPEKHSKSISRRQTESLAFLKLLIFSVSNNYLSPNSAATENIVRWLRGQKDLSLLTVLLSMDGPTADALAEKLFPLALKAGNTKIVKALMDRGIDPNQIIDVDEWECDGKTTSLRFACGCHSLELVQVLVAAGVDVNESSGVYLSDDGSYDDISPLTQAVMVSSKHYYDQVRNPEEDFMDLQLVRTLLNAGADINGASWPAYRPLVEAARLGHEKLIHFLLDRGADVNLEDKRGCLPVNEILSKGGDLGPERVLRMVKRLVEAGAEVNVEANSIMPLDRAAKLGSSELFKFLHSVGARPGHLTLSHAILGGSEELVRLALDIGAVESYETLQPSRDSTLAIAIRHRNSELFHLLFDSRVVRRDADVLAKSIEAASEVGMNGVVPTLLSAGKTYKAFANRLRPAVKAAVAARNFDMVKMLLQAGVSADVDTLVGAIRIKDVSIIEMLLKAGTPVNKGCGANVIKVSGNDNYSNEYDDSSNDDFDDDHLGELRFSRDTTPLEAAAQWGNRSLVQYLLEQGADIDDNKALVEAIRRQDSTLVSMLLDAGVPINRSWHRNTPTPLQVAVLYGNPSLIQVLLDHHADVHGSGTELSPLHQAIWSHRYDLVQMLLHAGADINDPATSAHRSSSLRLAINRNDKPMVEFLLANGADPNDSKALLAAVEMGDIKLMGGLLTARSRKYMARGRGFGCEALRATIRLASVELMDLLLSYGVDPNVACDSRTALGTAIRLNRSPDLKIIEKLLLAKADPNIPVETFPRRRQDQTALLKAIKSKSMPLMELLIQFGANISAPARGRILVTPLQAACKSRNLKAVKLLLSLGAEINAPPALRNGATALQFAAISGHVGIASLLLDNGADVNAPAAKFNGRTALEGAAEHGRIDMLSLLLHAGACIEGPGSVQYSRALQFAATNGHKAVRRLLESFALKRTGLNE